MIFKVHCSSCDSEFYVETNGNGSPGACAFCGEDDQGRLVREKIGTNADFVKFLNGVPEPKKPQMRTVTFDVTNPEALSELIREFASTIEAKRYVGEQGNDCWRVSVQVEKELDWGYDFIEGTIE